MSNTGINPLHYPAQRSFCDATISAGNNISESIALSGLHMVAMQRPAGLNISSISFEVSKNGTDWLPLRGADNTNLTFTISNDAAHQRLANIMDFEGADYVRLVAGSTVAADATFTLVLANV